MNLSSDVLDRADELKERRRTLHQFPETAFTEEKTRDYLLGELRALHPDELTVMAKTGVRAVFYAAGNAASTVAFRADIDALAIPEKTGAPYRSRREGFMHACGHDAHMAMLLSLAGIVSRSRDKLGKNVVLIFQPAEEAIGGAEPMIREGVLKHPDVDEIYGMHVWPDIPAGQIGLAAGPVMASVSDVNIVISGKSVHGAKPHLGTDAIVAGAWLVGALQTIISRDMDPCEPALLTIGKMQGGTSRNIICEELKLEGTMRAFSDSTLNAIRGKIHDRLKGLEAGFGVGTEYFETMYFPPVVNSESLVKKVAETLQDADIASVKPVMIAEDFSWYQREVPGVYLFLGVADAEHREPLHSSTFDLDEKHLLYGLEVFRRLAGIRK